MNHRRNLLAGGFRQAVLQRECSDGFTLIVVIVAMAIIVISMVMVMQLFSAGLKSARTSCDYTRAVVHARDVMEEFASSLQEDSGDFEDSFSWESRKRDYKVIEDTDYKLLTLIVKINWPSVMQKRKALEIVRLKATDGQENL